jgi:hypothetical protein
MSLVGVAVQHADGRVILDTHVTTGTRHDNQLYLEQLQRICDRYKITICEVIADRGYPPKSPRNYRFCIGLVCELP